MNTATEITKQNWFSNLVSGNARLTKAFYEAHLLWLFLIFLFYKFLVPIIITKLPITLDQAIKFLVIPIIVLINLYSLFSLIAIWRCAFNVNKPLYGYLARTYAMVIFPLTAYKFIKNIIS